MINTLIPHGESSTILVAAGTYTTPTTCVTSDQAVVCVTGRQVTLLGGYTTSDWSLPNPSVNLTLIDGQNARRGVRVFRNGPTDAVTSLLMQGFTIQNGLAQGASSGADSATFAYGGGMLVEHSAVTLRDIVFKNNRAIGGSTSQSYGGTGAGGALTLSADTWSAASATATLERVTFDGNQSLGGSGLARGGYAHGGGLFAYYVTVNGSYLTFVNNIATAGSSNGSGKTGLQTADALGGATSIEANSNVTLQYVTAMTNTVTGGNAPNGDPGGGYGGAFFAELATFTLRDATVRNNTARGGNGVDASGTALAEGGGLQSVQSAITLERVAVVSNTAQSGNGTSKAAAVGGGGVALTFSSTPFAITNSIIADNLAAIGTGTLLGGGGGGLWLQGITGNIVHGTIAGNRLGTTALLGQGVILVDGGPSWPTTVNINYGIVADHTQSDGSPSNFSDAAVYVQQNTTANISRPLFANNTTNTNAGASSPPPGTISISNQLSASSAGFISSGTPNFNYHILGSSSAKDQATGSATSTDFDSDTRPYNGVSDIGADEYAPFPLTVIPGDQSLQLGWSAAASRLTGLLDHYEILVTCASGANPPTGFTCGVAKDVGTVTSYSLTSLTNFKQYTITINARDAGSALIVTSTTVTSLPTNLFVYLPLIIK